MKNFRKELTLSKEQLGVIRTEVLSDKVIWSTQTNWTHAGQSRIDLHKILPMLGDSTIYEHDQTNPFFYKSPVCRDFPNTLSFLENFAKQKGELCRIVLFNLKENSEFLPHRDLGEYYRVRDRYHLVIESGGSFLQSSDEECIMQEGELWWFNNKELHHGKNLSPEKRRIHIIFDILPKGTETFFEKISRKIMNRILEFAHT
jgi:hypothetical protein